MLGGTRSAAALCAACLGDLSAVPQDAVVPVARQRGVFWLCSGCSGCSSTLNYQGHKACLVRRPRSLRSGSQVLSLSLATHSEFIDLVRRRRLRPARKIFKIDIR